ncbi:hypothetical protein NKR23_g12371 [Pleurostoma richardsiae]|uniref:Ubiquitin-like protease family profile domain-containing protein n=1 Tax=Pleurostoma richardsiae TaxID=41990 RepID=A0AA38R280_9PEZI|nr:hypothetical protein NKR23_g12371 [Pleurostoma richardsiae]
MVSKVGLGILLLENIWTYEKMKDDEFDSKVSDECQRDPRKMKILSIFEDQVRFLVDEGQPSLSHFLSSLESDKIIPSSEISELQIEYGLETEPISEDSTTAQAGHLADKVRNLLSKPGVEPDTVMIRDNIELPVDSINRIRRGQWLDMWIIAAAMELTDKPSCVRYGLSVPLHDDKSGRPITNPFGLWKRKIDEYRRNADSDEKLVYFCPLNLDANHFTLLEINEQNRMILH